MPYSLFKTPTLSFMMTFVTGSLGSFRLPICLAPNGQALTQAVFMPLRYAVIAEIAFVGDMVLRMEETHAVGTTHDAIAAADAPRPVDQHQAVSCLIGAPTGQTWTQGGFSHWLQSFGTKNALSISSGLGDAGPASPWSMIGEMKPSLAPLGESASIFPSLVTTYRSTQVRVTSAS